MVISESRRIFLLAYIGLLAAHACLSGLTATGFLTEGRSLLLAVGLFYAWLKRGTHLVMRFERRCLQLLAQSGIALALYFAPLTVCALSGEVTFTYGNNGLDPTFVSRLPWYGLFYGLSVLLGTEMIFRRWALAGLPRRGRRCTGPVMLCAGCYTLWVIPGLYPYVRYAETVRVMLFLLILFLNASIAGYWYILSGNLVISGLWTFVTEFFQYYLLSDIDLALNSAYFWVSSTRICYAAWLSAQTVILLWLFFQQSRQRMHLSDPP